MQSNTNSCYVPRQIRILSTNVYKKQKVNFDYDYLVFEST